MKDGAGYSGTPLAKKLGIKEESRVLLVAAPENGLELLDPLPPGVAFERWAGKSVDAAVWVSWPKKAANVNTTVSEGTIRELALPIGFVDVKVCAVSEVWSGLKFVVRKALR